jgi:hypothetical protein
MELNSPSLNYDLGVPSDICPRRPTEREARLATETECHASLWGLGRPDVLWRGRLRWSLRPAVADGVLIGPLSSRLPQHALALTPTPLSLAC